LKGVLYSIIDSYVTIASKVFPEKASLVSKTESKFYFKKRAFVLSKCTDFLEKMKEDNVRNEVETMELKVIYFDIEQKIYYWWCHMGYLEQRPQVEIVVDVGRVGEYTKPVVYYISGWLLSLLNGTAQKRFPALKKVLKAYYLWHTLTSDEAEAADLPTEMLRHWKKKTLTYPSPMFYTLT
jgi:hypothetical protein